MTKHPLTDQGIEKFRQIIKQYLGNDLEKKKSVKVLTIQKLISDKKRESENGTFLVPVFGRNMPRLS